MGVSDIHIEPYGDKRETVVRLRVDGSCSEYMKIPQSYRRAIVSRLKIMASLDIAERRKPQDGKIKFKLGGNKEIELRVATIPTAGYNEDIVMRILAASEPLPLDKLGFSERNLKELGRIADKPYGIILCVGPTGSGKTTTLHSVLGHIIFSSLHTNNSVETITRLLDMGCDSFSFADAMLGVLAQRLCKRICKDCKQEYHPPQEEYDELVAGYGGEHWKKLGISYDKTFKLYRGKGCDACTGTGFRGRLAIHELLLGTDRMKRLIQAKAKTEEMLKLAIEEGMTTLVQDGFEKVLQGLTTFKQVKAVAIK